MKHNIVLFQFAQELGSKITKTRWNEKAETSDFFNRNSGKNPLSSATAKKKRLAIVTKILPRILVGKKQMTAKFLWFHYNAQNIYNIFFLPSKIDNFQVTHSLKAFYSIGRNNCHQVNGSAMWLRSLYRHEGHSRPKKPWGNHCILALRPFK